jgi:hypothetical protein
MITLTVITLTGFRCTKHLRNCRGCVNKTMIVPNKVKQDLCVANKNPLSKQFSTGGTQAVLRGYAEF